MRAAVPAGDYAVHAPDGNVLAAVERKSLENLAATLSDGTLAFQLQRLAEVPLAATPAASPKTGPTASSRQRSPTRPTRTRTAETPRPGRPVPAICPELERIGVSTPTGTERPGSRGSSKSDATVLFTPEREKSPFLVRVQLRVVRLDKLAKAPAE